MQSTENSTGISENVPARELTDVGYSKECIERQKQLGFPNLTDQERGFAIDFIQNGYDHCLSAEKVGKSRSYGKKFLANPIVAAFIKHLQADIWQESIITHHFVEMKYMELLDMAMGEEEIRMVDKDGNEFRGKLTDITNSVKIIEKMSNMNGHSEKKSKGGEGGVTIKIDMNAFLGSGGPKELGNVGVTIDMDKLDN